MPRKPISFEEYKLTLKPQLLECLVLDGSTFKTIGSKLSVTCPVHGTFEVWANSLQRCSSCPRCSREATNKKLSALLSSEEFKKEHSSRGIENAHKLHKEGKIKLGKPKKQPAPPEVTDPKQILTDILKEPMSIKVQQAIEKAMSLI